MAPQLDALTADAELVTMTIGGNDNNVFIGSIAACGSAGLAMAGQGSPCKDTYGSYFDDQVESATYPNVLKALQDVRAKAPAARVAILGYPQILPPETGCFPTMPVATGDVPYLRALQAHLNAVIQRAAAETGVTFVDLSVVSEGHDACQPAGVRWVEPPVTTEAAFVHPNARGEAAMAAQAMGVLGLARA